MRTLAACWQMGMLLKRLTHAADKTGTSTDSHARIFCRRGRACLEVGCPARVNVSVHINGACQRCRQSSWMQAFWAHDPIVKVGCDTPCMLLST